MSWSACVEMHCNLLVALEARYDFRAELCFDELSMPARGMPFLLFCLLLSLITCHLSLNHGLVEINWNLAGAVRNQRAALHCGAGDGSYWRP